MCQNSTWRVPRAIFENQGLSTIMDIEELIFKMYDSKEMSWISNKGENAG